MKNFKVTGVLNSLGSLRAGLPGVPAQAEEALGVWSVGESVFFPRDPVKEPQGNHQPRVFSLNFELFSRETQLTFNMVTGSWLLAQCASLS